MDKYDRELLTVGAIRFYMGKTYFRYIGDIKLLDRYSDVYNESQLINMGFDLSKINTIGVGPKTVLYIYPEDNLKGTPTKYLNDSDKEKTFNAPHKISSLMLYTLENYYRVLKEKSCTTDKDCDGNQYCLCRDGKDDIRWCKKEGKICMPKSSYMQSDVTQVADNYIIDHKCVVGKFNEDSSFFDLKKIVAACVSNIPGSQYLFKEGFCVLDNDNNKLFIFYFIVLALVVLYFYNRQ